MSAQDTVQSLFGTDGIRDRAGCGLLEPESIRDLARAIARALGERSDNCGDRVLVGRDTRASGVEILDSMANEFGAAGFEVGDLGILPTPGVAFSAANDAACCLAVVLSASHNPSEYNGIKLLSAGGSKASDEFEASVTEHYFALRGREGCGGHEGNRPRARLDLSAALRSRYVDFLVASCQRPERLRGKKIVLDTAHGAAFEVAPEVFRRLGAECEVLGAEPNGENINEGCGALNPAVLAERVRESGAVCGFSFDGDADRMIPVTGEGTVLDGDFVLALAGRAYSRAGKLPRSVVVGTVMSNIGLERALDGLGLTLLRAAVGDRHVSRALVEGDHPVGGEQSGHLIFRDFAPTGDGVLAALRLVDVLEGDGVALAEEARIMRQFPQVLKNVRVRERLPLLEIEGVQRAVARVEARLGDEGRVLLRYSGTEPLARVMLEGPEQALIESLADEICAEIQAVLGVE